MTPVTSISSQQGPPAVSTSQPSRTPTPLGSAAQPGDTLHLSPTALREVALNGRVALAEGDGAVTSDQAQQLYSQASSIHNQIVADKQADGGTLSSTDAQAIQQSQNQLSQTIYGDAHNGAAPPADPTTTRAGARQGLEAGRITLNEQAGNLTGAQAQQLSSQQSTISQQITADEQANGGTLSTADKQAINQMQSHLSQQIYATAHGASPTRSTVSSS
jgi:hypothetical protein